MAEEDPREPPDERAPGHEGSDDDADRAAILARRRALIRRTVASLGAVVVSGMVTDCATAVGPEDGSVVDAASMGDGAPQPCLRFAPDTGTVNDAAPQPCLGAPAPDVSPVDASDDVGMPMPCLDIAPAPDGGSD